MNILYGSIRGSNSNTTSVLADFSIFDSDEEVLSQWKSYLKNKGIMHIEGSQRVWYRLKRQPIFLKKDGY